jgi:branched-subunit amino acid aminotransferase/4-amino-4-deoxychorismate lyase
MTSFYLLNDEICKSAPLLEMDNKALLWGQSAFTTFLLDKSRTFLPELHLKRLQAGSKFMYESLIEDELLKAHFCVLAQNCSKELYRVRTTVLKQREKISLFSIIAKTPGPYISEKKLKLTILPEFRGRTFENTEVKVSGHYAQVFINKAKGIDADFLEQDDSGHLLGFSCSNLIIKKGQQWMTPIISGRTSGLAVSFFAEFLSKKGLKLEQKNLSRKDLINCDSIFSSNCVQFISIEGQSDLGPLLSKHDKKILKEFKDFYQLNLRGFL